MPFKMPEALLQGGFHVLMASFHAPVVGGVVGRAVQGQNVVLLQDLVDTGRVQVAPVIPLQEQRRPIMFEHTPELFGHAFALRHAKVHPGLEHKAGRKAKGAEHIGFFHAWPFQELRLVERVYPPRDQPLDTAFHPPFPLHALPPCSFHQPGELAARQHRRVFLVKRPASMRPFLAVPQSPYFIFQGPHVHLFHLLGPGFLAARRVLPHSPPPASQAGIRDSEAFAQSPVPKMGLAVQLFHHHDYSRDGFLFGLFFPSSGSFFSSQACKSFRTSIVFSATKRRSSRSMTLLSSASRSSLRSFPGRPGCFSSKEPSIPRRPRSSHWK